jgi:type IV secretory pathway VirD2 relaxase
MDWVAAVHDDPGHPHCHVAIRGRDMDGRQIYIGKKHVREFRRIVDEQKRLQAEHNLGPKKARDVMRELDQKAERIKSQPSKARDDQQNERGKSQPQRGFAGGLSKSLLDFFQQIARKGEREQELARQRVARAAR